MLCSPGNVQEENVELVSVGQFGPLLTECPQVLDLQRGVGGTHRNWWSACPMPVYLQPFAKLCGGSQPSVACQRSDRGQDLAISASSD